MCVLPTRSDSTNEQDKMAVGPGDSPKTLAFGKEDVASDIGGSRDNQWRKRRQLTVV
jgi:hypothetical protein